MLMVRICTNIESAKKYFKGSLIKKKPLKV